MPHLLQTAWYKKEPQHLSEVAQWKRKGAYSEPLTFITKFYTSGDLYFQLFSPPPVSWIHSIYSSTSTVCILHPTLVLGGWPRGAMWLEFLALASCRVHPLQGTEQRRGSEGLPEIGCTPPRNEGAPRTLLSAHTQLFLSLGSSAHCFLSCLQVATLHYPLVPTPLLRKLSFYYIPIKSWWVRSGTDICTLLLLSQLSHVQLLVTPWPAAHQAPPSMGFSRQEYWSGLPFPSPHIHTTVSKIDNQRGCTI